MAKKFLSKETDFFFYYLTFLRGKRSTMKFYKSGFRSRILSFYPGGGHQYLATSYLFMLMAQWAGTMGN